MRKTVQIYRFIAFKNNSISYLRTNSKHLTLKRSKKYTLTITVLLSIFYNNLFAQKNVKDSLVSAPLIQISYAFQVPGGDLADRFGVNSNAGIDFLYKTKSNWLFGASGNVIFGNTIKEGFFLDSIAAANGTIIGQSGDIANINLLQRGFHFQAKVGKIFPVFGPNKNSGIMVTFGAGYLRHRIRIEDSSNSTPNLEDEYEKGYDRLSTGFALSQFIGYIHLGNNKRTNFYFGFDFTQGWTKNRRGFNFDTRQADTELKNDFLYGIKVGWILPIYTKSDKYYVN